MSLEVRFEQGPAAREHHEESKTIGPLVTGLGIAGPPKLGREKVPKKLRSKNQTNHTQQLPEPMPLNPERT